MHMQTKPLIRPIEVVDGKAFSNCLQTFTWTGGGYEQEDQGGSGGGGGGGGSGGRTSSFPALPPAARVGAATRTPTAVFSGGAAGDGSVGGIRFVVDLPASITAHGAHAAAAAATNVHVHLYLGACGNTGVLTATLADALTGVVEAAYNYTMPPVPARSASGRQSPRSPSRARPHRHRQRTQNRRIR